jgi:uncharacterized membrane protein YraQ (UPF0718 family)
MRQWRALGHALTITGSMTWEILWALVFGFTLSAIIQSKVKRGTIVRLLGDSRPRTLALAAGLGAASSSCSYAAVALARALFRQGASFTAAMTFEVASTNLVVEMGVILALLIGWQFTLAEFVGGPVMIVLLAVLFRLFLRQRLLAEAQAQADVGRAGSMEGHAAMEMTSISHIFVMEWAAVIRDIVLGLLMAGAVAAWVPDSFWRRLFFVHHPLLSRFWGPLIGPVVSMMSFVCSIGNVPLAGVLWNGGMSFGGVVSFIFADLIILPILVIYRRYYGTRMMLFVAATFYATMVLAGYVVGFLFSGVGLVPATRHAKVTEMAVHWNYTTALNVVALLTAAVLVYRFVRSGALPMLKMMGGPPPTPGAGHLHS